MINKSLEELLSLSPDEAKNVTKKVDELIQDLEKTRASLEKQIGDLKSQNSGSIVDKLRNLKAKRSVSLQA